MNATKKIETQGEAADYLKSLGLKKPYRPQIAPESGTLLLATRKAPEIEAGQLKGVEIAYEPGPQGGTFRVWMSKPRKAKALAARYDLKVRLMDGEAEVWVPVHLADALLPGLGAKTKRELTPDQLVAARGRMQHARKGLCLGLDPMKNGGSGALRPKTEGLPA